MSLFVVGQPVARQTSDVMCFQAVRTVKRFHDVLISAAMVQPLACLQASNCMVAHPAYHTLALSASRSGPSLNAAAPAAK